MPLAARGMDLATEVSQLRESVAAMQQERDDSREEVARLVTIVAQMEERMAHMDDAIHALSRRYNASKVRVVGRARDRIDQT